MRIRKSLQIAARRTPGPLRRFFKRYFVPGLALRYLYPFESQVPRLEEAIWAGFGKAAAEKLETIKVDPRQPVGEVAGAAYALARWYATEGDFTRALENLTLRRLIFPNAEDEIRHLVLEIDMHLRLGRVDEAGAIIKQAMLRLGELPQLCLCAANAVGAVGSPDQSESDDLRLQWLNRPFLAAGLAPLELKDSTRPLSLDNIIAPAATADPNSARAKISVLMPAYNVENAIATAMTSVLNQTWTNIEMIVVDDGSTDATWSVIRSVASHDSRVVPLRHEENLGAYAARNTALRASTGDFVTVHDADDWSHPQKLALQVSNLLDSGAPVNTTKLARVYPDMRVRIKPTDGAVLIESIASVFIRRSRIMELGGWDEVRIGADNEFYRRLLLLERRSRNIVCPEVPLAFYLARDDSLSAQRDIGLSTLLFGARREYQDSYRHWHLSEIEKEKPHLAISKDNRPFPIPNICKSRRPKEAAYDILFVSDYTFPGGTTSSNVNMLQAASRLGLRCGCFHWPRMLYAGSTMNLKIRQLLHEGIAESVVAPEAVTSKLVIVYQPMLLNDLPERLPAVRADYCVLGVNQTPMSRSLGGRDLYCLDDAIENLDRAFGLKPFIAPVSPVVRKVLQASSSYRNYTDLDWAGLINSAAWRRSGSSWDKSRLPIVGRHSRDSTDKWPSDPVALRQAYCAGTSLEVRILGGAERARAVLGRIPRNWTVQPFDSCRHQNLSVRPRLFRSLPPRELDRGFRASAHRGHGGGRARHPAAPHAGIIWRGRCLRRARRRSGTYSIPLERQGGVRGASQKWLRLCREDLCPRAICGSCGTLSRNESGRIRDRITCFR